jgi:hypothetical protein
MMTLVLVSVVRTNKRVWKEEVYASKTDNYPDPWKKAFPQTERQSPDA